MKKLQTQKGFTLVELAIVMTIIGLLIGGILKGQELITTARVTATVAQVKAFESAIITFRGTYAFLPGDLPNAQNRLAGCTVTCNNTVAGTTGDGVVGPVNWAATARGNWAPTVTGNIGGTAAPNAVGAEQWLFWQHLAQARLIGGVQDAPLHRSVAQAWTVTHPEARVGGGFIAGNTQGNPAVGMPTAFTNGPTGLTLALVNFPATGVVAGNPPLLASVAAQIDRRIDDGRPGSGDIFAFGAGTCMDNTTRDYVEATTTPACGLLVRMGS